VASSIQVFILVRTFRRGLLYQCFLGRIQGTFPDLGVIMHAQAFVLAERLHGPQTHQPEAFRRSPTFPLHLHIGGLNAAAISCRSRSAIAGLRL
jgi:hypothetical protein